MSIGPDIAYFFGGFLLANAVPHVVAALLGRPLQSPFAKPPGEGYSSSTVNAVWGWSNLVVGYLLLFHVGSFDVRSFEHVLCAAVPAFLCTLLLARRFGQFNGGNRPLEEQAKRDR